MTAISIETPGKSRRHLPGEAGVWVFIVGDMVMFGVFFVVYVYYRAQNGELFQQSQQTLNQIFGLVNTLLLLTSSWFAASAVHAARRGLAGVARGLLAATFFCGAVFAINKFFEYEEKIRAGITLNTNEFFTLYFMYTGIHLLHVLMGMALLAFVWSRVRKDVLQKGDIQLMETGTTFWHLVDLLWIVLFALLYLVK